MADTYTISIDFQDYEPAEAKVSVLDHGFLFGDSVYEAVRTWKGAQLFPDEHLARLARSAQGIDLTLPHGAEEYKAGMERQHRRSGNESSYIRLIVTRGTGTLELATESCTAPRSIIIVKPLQEWPGEYYTTGAKLSIVSVRRNAPRATNPAFKTGNYLNNVMAIEQARAVGAIEAAMLDGDGMLTECTTSNLFYVKDGEIFTPELEVGILAGVTRSKVLALCEELGIPCREGRWTPENLLSADEVFITSTTRDVMPISRVDDTVIGSGERGEITHRLIDAYRRLCDRAIGDS